LFGPTDHDENIRFVENELKKARNEASSRWNFDFDSGNHCKETMTGRRYLAAQQRHLS